jgi:exonuclease III
MRGVFWNVRGMRKVGKKQCLMEMIKEHDLDFIGVQETKKEEFTDTYLNVLGGSKQFS